MKRIGPSDHGREMSLDDFDIVDPAEGYLYELGHGLIEVSEFPDPKHAKTIQELWNQLIPCRVADPDAIYLLAGGSDSKILVDAFKSERHPDLSIYFRPPPPGPDVWSRWIPQIVIEVVSERSIKRDYETKPPEYLAFGVSEYWIVDGLKNQMTVLSRWRGQWQEKIIKASCKHKTPLLQGFSLDVGKCLSPGRR